MNYVHLSTAVLVCFHLTTLSQCVYLNNVDCGTYPNYVPTDHERSSRYYPCVVQLHRCTGANTAYDLSYKKCTPLHEGGTQEVDIDVYDMVKGAPVTLKIANHTSCEETCIIGPSACSKYETFSHDECVCHCNYDHVPDPNPCHPPFQWEQTLCDCTCSIDPATCSEKKEFKAKECGCFCKMEYQERCAREMKVLDPETCDCLDPTVVSRSSDEFLDHHLSGVSVTSLVLILQTVVIVGFVVSYFYNRRKGYETISAGDKC